MRRSAVRFAIILLLLIATGLRLYRIDHQSFWNDEGNSARLSERTVQLIIEGTASDVHPPAYYLLLRGSRDLIGASEFSLRAISALAGILTVAGTIALGRAIMPVGYALSAGLLTACAPALIYYSQEARMYSLLSTLTVLSTLILFKWLKEVQKNSTSAHFILYPFSFTLFSVLGLYTHYVYPAILLAHGLIVILFAAVWYFQPAAQRISAQSLMRGLVSIFLAAVGALILYLPWFPIFLRTGSSTRDVGVAGPLEFFQRSVKWIIAGPFPGRLAGQDWYPLLVLALIVIVVLIVTVRQLDWIGSALVLWLYVTPAMMFMVGSTDENYLKFLTTVVPALWLLVAYVLSHSHKLHGPIFSPMLLLSGVTLFAVWGVSFPVRDLYFDSTNFRADYRGMASQILNEDFADAGIILNAPNQWEVFTYYYNGPAEVYPLPKQREAADKIAADVNDIVDKHARVYALFWGFEGFDPERTVERTLDSEGFKAVDEWRGDVRFVSYAVPAAPATEPTDRLLLDFEQSGIFLDGYALQGRELKPGDIVQMTLFWRAAEPVGTRYKVFVHVLNQEGMLVAQRDSEPVGNLKPTDGWDTDERVIDNHGILLPPDLPAGVYDVRFGLYDFADPSKRVLIVDNTNGQTGDSYSLADIIVK